LKESLRVSAIILALMTLLTGGVYPLVVTLTSQAIFPTRAGGSLIRVDGKAAGSELIGQPFSRPEYFWGRLSATAPVPCNAAASSGSNLGPLNPDLPKNALSRVEDLRKHDPAIAGIPVDLATASGSGLDPHISPAAAEVQVRRVAAARRMPENEVRAIVRLYTEGRQLGVLGEPRVNVLLLNLALDRGPRPTPVSTVKILPSRAIVLPREAERVRPVAEVPRHDHAVVEALPRPLAPTLPSRAIDILP
jgi:K+-transporting ATPase ATPase C chain